MNPPVQKAGGVWSLLGDFLTYRRQTGRSLLFWALLALLNLVVQLVFRHDLAPGEFATLNTLLSVIGLILTPVLALEHALDHFEPRGPEDGRRAILREARLPLVKIVTAAWALLVTALLFPLLGLLGLPRTSLGFFMLPTVLLALGALVGAAMCGERSRPRALAALVLTAAMARLAFAAVLTPSEPWAEMGLVAGWLASVILLAPLWRETGFDLGWARAKAAWHDREFVLHAGATLSVLLGLFLFTNGDRIVAQAWFGQPQENNLGYVPWTLFDSYQAAGLVGRALLWGTQPLLLLFLVRRKGADHTSAPLRNLGWIYFGAIIGGAFLLSGLAAPLGRLFSAPGDTMTAYFIPGFAGVMIPLGLLQGIGIFALASRRYPECFTLGGASLGYVALLYAVGRPQLMLSYAFGGGTVALTLVLLVGIVRWGRRQP